VIRRDECLIIPVPIFSSRRGVLLRRSIEKAEEKVIFFLNSLAGEKKGFIFAAALGERRSRSRGEVF
jgi:hypothetical protein